MLERKEAANMSDRETLEQNLRDAEKNAEAANRALQAARDALRTPRYDPTPDELAWLDKHGFLRWVQTWDWVFDGEGFRLEVGAEGDEWYATFEVRDDDGNLIGAETSSGPSLFETLGGLKAEIEAVVQPWLGALRILRGEG